ncbi:MAG: exonuclease subunit SbcD, partial [Deltaproteobacteria bacterium]|nr:exonuclease subunit SbcD [Deltaproteobacteria bacterium]
MTPDPDGKHPGMPGQDRERSGTVPGDPPYGPSAPATHRSPAARMTPVSPVGSSREGSSASKARGDGTSSLPFAPPERKLVMDSTSGKPSLQGPAFRFIHTSDWHLGKKLDSVERHEEFRGFLDWLAALLVHEKADALIVAGDIFDVPAPPVWAQQLYYGFMKRAMAAGVSVVVTSGNHDSQPFLEAPRPVLSMLGVHVSALPQEDPADELVVLGAGSGGGPAAIVAAVPFLREQDVRAAVEAESSQDEGRGIAAAVSARYAESAAAARALQRKLGRELPVIGVGHLMAAGASFNDGDGIRTLYGGEKHPGGALAADPSTTGQAPEAGARPGPGEITVGGAWGVDTGPMAELFDYTALGHIHRPQRAGGETVRYSGSPIPLRFSEAGTAKSVTLVEMGRGRMKIECLAVPVFREIRHVEGTMAEVGKKLRELIACGSNAVVAVSVTGSPLSTSLSDEVDAIVRGSGLEVTVVRNIGQMNSIRAKARRSEEGFLKEMDERDVFIRLLDDRKVMGEEDRKELLLAYDELLASLEDEGHGQPAAPRTPAAKAGTVQGRGRTDAGAAARPETGPQAPPAVPSPPGAGPPVFPVPSPPGAGPPVFAAPPPPGAGPRVFAAPPPPGAGPPAFTPPTPPGAGPTAVPPPTPPGAGPPAITPPPPPGG